MMFDGFTHIPKLSLGGTNEWDADVGFSTDGKGTLLLQNSALGIAFLTTAIRANITTTTLPVHTLGLTTHATGAGTFFVSDGSKWQYISQAVLAAVLGGDLSVGGNATVTGTLGVTGLATLVSLLVSTTTTFTGAVTFSAGLAALLQAAQGITGINGASMLMANRTRTATASVNTGVTLLPAVTGKGYRLTRAELIAIGGSAAATANATGVAIYGTQSTSKVALLTIVLAGLTRSTINSMTGTNSTVLADGASFVKCDAATAITIQAVGGSDLITATNFDSILSYVLE
jgi:hypothetical protein